MTKNNPYKAEISLDEHTKQPWRAHALLTDFEIEDVWRLPVTLTAEQSAAEVRRVLFSELNHLQEAGAAGFLFKLRFFLGRVFGWDSEPETDISLRPGSLRERYADAEGLTAEQLPKPTGADFIPVYALENEFLEEIENKTVHAAIHTGRVPLGDEQGNYTMQMAIYVKPNGGFGRAYMAAIKPFRHWIVYPAMMRMIEKQWLQGSASSAAG
ncbi:MAG: DUF2867 domain-containing protein [Anaerolineae bacterium]